MSKVVTEVLAANAQYLADFGDKADLPMPPVRLRKSVQDVWLTLTMREGRNRQVRRMTAAIGHPTLRLIRVQIGDWSLGDLQSGQWRQLSI